MFRYKTFFLSDGSWVSHYREKINCLDFSNKIIKIQGLKLTRGQHHHFQWNAMYKEIVTEDSFEV